MKKQGKKWMLVAIALLAMVTVALPLVGCKNDSVAEPVRYTVTFNNNGGTGTMNPQSFTAGEKLAANTFTRTGFVFVGWSEDSKATSATYRDKAEFTANKDTPLYAVWIQLLTFTSDSETHLEVTYNGSIGVPTDMAYSTDGETWTAFTERQQGIPFGNGTELYLRGKSSTGTATDWSNFVDFKFADGTKVYASGDIRTLVDWKDPVNANTSNARFCWLFDHCTQLVTAPALPAETLADYCYFHMFKDCTGLKTAPELKAETLAGNCYSDMFFGCTNLASVTMLATDVSATGALGGWLRGTDGGTLYVANNDMVNDPTILGDTPSEWKIEVAPTGEQPN